VLYLNHKRERKKGNRKMKTLRNLVVILTVIFLVWFAVSYCEILTQNLDFENPTVLSNWNFFNFIS